MNIAKRMSLLIMAGGLIMVGWIHLTTLLLTILFGFFGLKLFTIKGRKDIAVGIYLALIAVMSYGLFYFTKRACREMPKIIDKAIPAVVEYAEKQNVDLPFSDYASLKSLTLTEVKNKIVNVGHYTREAILHLVMVVVGLVVAPGVFLNSGLILEGDPLARKGSLYLEVGHQLSMRFETFYESFSIVIGAQIIISTINTLFTACFIFGMGYPHAILILFTTFLCGLLPIIGNIMSNTFIVVVGFTESPQMAMMALLFLVVVHKMEYFLNSKIIGHRIKNPMWLTLVGLVIGEKMMGIPGMILAPVVLHYIKVESSKVRAAASDPGFESL